MSRVTGGVGAFGRLVACAVVAVLAPISVPAKEPETAGAARTVHLFDRLCYDMVPDLAALEERAATMKWTPITDRRLQQFKPAAPAKVLKAWELTDLGIAHMIAVSRAAMDEQGKADFPDFATAEVVACSLVLPRTAPRAEISAAMQKLMERPADDTSQQGSLTVDTWAGSDGTRQVIINHMGDSKGGAGGLLSIVFMQKG